MINLRPVQKIVVRVFFVPMACRVLETTSVGNCVNIFEGGEEYWNQDSSHVAIPSKWFLFDSCRVHGTRSFEETAKVAAQGQGLPPGAWSILAG
jgi:hypothetical protein